MFHRRFLILGLTVTLLLCFVGVLFQTQAHVSAQALTFTHLSTDTNDLDLPSGSTEQTAALVLDINNDGLNDFVIAGRQPPGPSMVWYERTADSWTRHVIESDVLRIEAGGTYHDIDGDGDLDIVMGGDAQTDEVWWWENPYPNFGSDWTRRLIKDSGNRKHHDQIFGDFDGDGQTELVFWNQKGTGHLYLAEIPADPRNTEPWSLNSIYTWSGGDEHEGLASADIDGDGVQDIVGGGRWFKHTGGGNFTAEIVDDSLRFGRSAAAQLIPGGRPEIVFAAGDFPGAIRYYEWEGGQWVSHTIRNTIERGHSLKILDVNQDGHLDIFAAEMRLNGSNNDAVTLFYLGDGAGNFTEEVVATGYGNHESIAADLDGDCDIDILGKPYNWDTPRIDIWLNEANNGCGGGIELDDWDRTLVDGSRPWRAIFTYPADINGDGDTDIVTGGWWYENPGSGGGNWTRHTIGAPMNNMAVIHDFDGDNDLDIFGTQGEGSASNRHFAWAENDGNGNFTIHTNIPSAPGGDFLQGAVAERFSAGSPIEIALSWHKNGNGTHMLTVPADPTSGNWSIRQISTASQEEDLSTGDLDRDGDIDIVMGTEWLRNDTQSDSSWVENRRYRVAVTVDANGTARTDKPADVEIDFGALLSGLGAGGSFDADSLRVVEVDGNSVVDNSVAFQFDADSADAGTLVVMLDGTTAETASRTFHVYFDTNDAGPFTPANVAAQVALTDNVTDEGQASLQIDTNAATYFYHKAGGGFSSLVDANGNDWINHSSATGAAGDFRGIPNLVHPNDGGYFHPGRNTAETTILHQGPLKATFASTADNGNWRTLWEVYPDYATLTVTDIDGNYWFLYEGTPGGTFDTNDRVIRGDGTDTNVVTDWTGDLSPEWVLFADGTITRSLFTAHHEDDSIVDSYTQIDNDMTVFGFGRDGGTRDLSAVPNQFTIGLLETTSHGAAVAPVANAIDPLSVSVDSAEVSTTSATGPWTLQTLFNGGDPDRNRTADINGDGRLDVAIGYETSSPSGKVAWYEQPANLNQSWTEHMIDTVIGPLSLDVADMDNDGDMDVIVGEHRTNNTSILSLIVYENSQGDGSEWITHTVHTGDEHHDGAQAADFDNDNDLDLVSIGWTHSDVLIYTNLSSGGSAPPATVTPGPQPTSTATPNGGSGDPTATPTSEPPTATPVPGACNSVPGNLLANPDFENGTSDWSFNTGGNGNLTTDNNAYNCDAAGQISISRASGTTQVFQRNFAVAGNTEYTLTFAAYSSSGNDMTVDLLKHTSPYNNLGLSESVDLTTGWQLFSYTFTTTSGQSNARLRFRLSASNDDVYWLDYVSLSEGGTTAPTPTSTPDIVVPTATSTPNTPGCEAQLTSWSRHVLDADRPSGITQYSWAVDINGDGWEDVVTGGHWYENPQTGQFTGWTRHDVGNGYGDTAEPYDFDGDGDLDLLGTTGTNWPLVWAENDGNGNFTVYTNLEDGLTQPENDPIQGVAIGHFNPNGPLQVAITWDDTEEPNKNPNGIQLYTVPADPSSGTWSRTKLSDFSRGEELQEADVDSDGDLDLYLGGFWLRNDYPASTWTLIETFAIESGHIDRHFVVDVDGDGDLDTIDAYGHDDRGLVAWYEQPDNDPFGTWIEHEIFQSNTYPGFASMDIADMDGDGDLDIVTGEHAWFGDLSRLRTFVHENLDGEGGSWATYEIYAGDETHNGIRIADFDKDGDPDLVSTGYKHTRVHLYENTSNPDCGTPVPTATTLPTATPTTDAPAPTVTPTPDVPAPTATATPDVPAPTATATIEAPTATPTSEPVVGGCSAVTGTLISNPSFENGTSDWSFRTNGSGSMSLSDDAYDCDSAVTLNLVSSGSNVQFFQNGVSLKANTNYTLTFAAYSDNGNNFNVELLKHGSPYTNYGLREEVDLGTGWQLHTVQFTTSGFNGTVNDGRFRFRFYGVNNTTFQIDAVNLVETDSVPPTPIATATATPTPDVPVPTATATMTPDVPVPTATSTPDVPDPTATATIEAPTPVATATATPTSEPVVGGCSAVTGTLISNPSFEDGTSDWSFRTNGSGSMSLSDDAYDCDSAVRLNLVSSGSNVQLFQNGVSLKANTDYTLTFAAYSDNGNNFNVELLKHGSPYTNYGLREEVDLGTGWQLHTVQFTTSGFNGTVNDGRFRFRFYGVNNTTFLIDAVNLVETGSVPPTPVATATATPDVPAPTATATPDVPDPTATATATATIEAPTPVATATATPTSEPVVGGCSPVAGNLLSNGHFESNLSSWTYKTNGSGSASVGTPAYGCDGAAKIVVNNLGSNTQFLQDGVQLEANTTYRLTFAAYSSDGTDFDVELIKDSSPYNSYGIAEKVNLTTGWQVYTLDFTSTGFSGTVNNGRFRFRFYEGSNVTFWVDNLSLVKGDGSPPPPTATPDPSSPTATPTAVPSSGGNEMVVYDWNREVTTAERGFPRDTPPWESANGDWTSPINYAEGTFYYRVEIRDQPEPQNMQLQFCVWQDNHALEACGPREPVLGSPGNVVTWSADIDDMWKKNGNPIDWSRPRMRWGIAIKNSSGQPVSPIGDFNWGGEDPDDWYPIDWRFTVVVVAKGETFSGWHNYTN